MDYKVILSPRAIQDLNEIVRYISFDDSVAAERFGYALIDAALSLATLPERGRLVPNSMTRLPERSSTARTGLFIGLTRSRRLCGLLASGTLPGERQKSAVGKRLHYCTASSMINQPVALLRDSTNTAVPSVSSTP